MTDRDEMERFRAEVRAFLAASLPPDLAERGLRNFRALDEDVRIWTRILEARGWSVPSWPVEYGGPGWTLAQQHVFEIECLRAGAPPLSPQGLHLVGPVIYTFGSDEQKAHFLPGIRNGTMLWTQGFSEPNSGSDLGSLQTRAERDGDMFVVNGQKIWTSDAVESEWLFLLVRSRGPDGADGGVSFLLVDMQTPGITVRPIRSIDGASHLNELFLDDVRVPVANLLGEEGKGWSYAKFLLTLERSSSAVVPQCVVALERLKALVAASPASDDPLIEARIADLEIDLMAHEATTNRVIADEQNGRGEGSFVASTLKIRGSELLQRIGDVAIDAVGAAAMPFYERTAIDPDRLATRPLGAEMPGFVAEYMFRRAGTIYGGANEIQRNILAKALFKQ